MPISISRAARSGSSCDHTRYTAHPERASRASVSRSRRRLPLIFRRHQEACTFGQVACSGQACQKHPSTKTATRAEENTRSARRLTVGMGLWSIRKRSPRRCNSDLSATSAGVSRRFVACIRRLTRADDAGGRSLSPVERRIISPAVCLNDLSDETIKVVTL
jgi:hypothetical protein